MQAGRRQIDEAFSVSVSGVSSGKRGVGINVCIRSCLAFARHSKFCSHGIYFKMAVIVSNYDRDRK